MSSNLFRKWRNLKQELPTIVALRHSKKPEGQELAAIKATGASCSNCINRVQIRLLHRCTLKNKAVHLYNICTEHSCGYKNK